MTIESWLEALAMGAKVAPELAEAVRRIIVGHPSAVRVRDVLEEQGLSEVAAEEMRREREG